LVSFRTVFLSLSDKNRHFRTPLRTPVDCSGMVFLTVLHLLSLSDILDGFLSLFVTFHTFRLLRYCVREVTERQ